MAIKKILSRSEFDILFEDFTQAIHHKQYTKLPYNDWRCLNSITDSVKLYHFPVTQLITIETNHCNYIGDTLILSFNTEDGSFGQFLKENVFTFIKENKNEKEIDDNMKNFNFEFGPCTDNLVRVSMYGLAIKNTAGTWVSYNTKDNSIVDVDVFSFDNMGKFIYKIPVAVKDVAVGDVVIHNRVPMFVEECTDEEHFVVVDVRSGERKEIIPTKNMLGFNFITKVVSLFNAVGNAPTPDAPFGNMLPFLMMDDDNKDINPMMLMLMAQSQGGNFGDVMNNPMMLYCMMKNEDNDILPWFFMMNNFKG